MKTLLALCFIVTGFAGFATATQAEEMHHHHRVMHHHYRHHHHVVRHHHES